VLHTGEFGLRDAVIGLSQALTDGGGAGLDGSANKFPQHLMQEAANMFISDYRTRSSPDFGIWEQCFSSAI
jgi:hypothetical protein